jgi:hypothetical protein
MSDPWMVKQLSNPEAERWLASLGDALRTSVPARMGFALLLFDFGERGGMYYTSNAERASVLTAMHEFIEKNQPPKEAHDG